MTISLIVAVARNGVIGRDGRMPWHLPADLKQFKRTTMGKPVLMGRKTHQSIGRPLPGRTNIVISRDPDFAAEGCTVVSTIPDALEAARAVAGDEGEVMVIGGGAIYAALLPRADRIYLTRIATDAQGDTRFPDLDPDQWREVRREERPADERNPHDAEFLVLERVDR